MIIIYIYYTAGVNRISTIHVPSSLYSKRNFNLHRDFHLNRIRKDTAQHVNARLRICYAFLACF